MAVWEIGCPIEGLPSAVTSRDTNPIRELAFPVFAVVAAVYYADVRIPMGLPGHRGLIWLTLLVAVALATRRRATVLAVGAATTAATMAMHIPGGISGPLGSGNLRYLSAAILLYLVAGLAAVGRHRWLLVLAAAPIHLVALVDSPAAVARFGEKAMFHLGFGVVAGLLGFAIAAAMAGVRRAD